MTHLLLTRFAVPFERYPITPAWLARRFDLFTRYCLPSVQAQTFGGFQWWIYVHPGFDVGLARQLEACDPRIVLVETTEHPRTLPVVPGADWLTTTRLDSDDGFASTVMATMRDEARRQTKQTRRPVLLDYPTGWYLHLQRGKVYLGHGSAYKTLVDRQPEDGPARSVYGHSCDLIRRHYRTVQIKRPLWLRVIHGGNVSNRFDRTRSTRPLSSLAGSAFPWLTSAEVAA